MRPLLERICVKLDTRLLVSKNAAVYQIQSTAFVYISFVRYFCENRRFSKHTHRKRIERQCNQHIRVLIDEKWSISVTPDQIDFTFEVRLQCAIFSVVQCNSIISSRMQHFLLYFRTFSSHCSRPNVCYYTDRGSFKERKRKKKKERVEPAGMHQFYRLS